MIMWIDRAWIWRDRRASVRGMPAWKIASFDRVLARGTIACDLGTLVFDANAAVVDDFVIGEEVVVTLSPNPKKEGGYDVTRIAPVKYRAPYEAKLVAPIAEAIDAWVIEVLGRHAWIDRVEDDCLYLRVEDDSYRPERWVVFGGVVMIQGPPEIEEIGAVRAFGPSDVLRASPELARHWPTIPDHCVVFRVDPIGFAGAALTVAASEVRLVVAGAGGARA